MTGKFLDHEEINGLTNRSRRYRHRQARSIGLAPGKCQPTITTKALRAPVKGEAPADPEDMVTDEPETPPEPVREYDKALMTNAQSMALWSQETGVRLVMEFINECEFQFTELNAFFKKHH